MISERQLAKDFNFLWKKHFPLQDPTFTRRFNAQTKTRLKSASGEILLPIPMGENISQYDLVSEIAFEMAFLEQAYPNTENLEARAINLALEKIKRLRGVENPPEYPCAEEIGESTKIVAIYRHFFETNQPIEDFVYRPAIPGIGVLDSMEADFCSSETLYEVKTVNRSIQSHDIRQLVTYLIAGLHSKKFNWSKYCIFNPRRAEIYRGSVSDLLLYLSGVQPAICIHDFSLALEQREEPNDLWMNDRA